MILRDYHLHSKFSFDSNEEPENICEAAIERGISEICFTEHFEFGAPDDAAWPDVDVWNAEIDRLRSVYDGRLNILQGIEAGQPLKEPEKAKRLMDQLRNRLDFVIGSLHVVGDTGRPSKYEFTRDNYQDYFKRYFEEAKELAEFGDFDVMGHITFPFRYPSRELVSEYPIERYEKDIRQIYDILVSRGKGIEINTSGYRTPLEDAMPGETLVRWYKEQGGTIITIGSDGHSARSACLNVEKGYGTINSIGFASNIRFMNRQWTSLQ